eukprot:120719_1
MTTFGRCKAFKPKRGYGFIRPNDGTGDVFVHWTNITGAPSKSKAIKVGEMVQFDILIQDDGRKKAINVKIVESMNHVSRKKSMKTDKETNLLLSYWARKYAVPLLSIPIDIVFKYRDSKPFEFSSAYKGENVILQNNNSTAINTNYWGCRNYGNVRTDHWITHGVHQYEIQFNVVANPSDAYGSYIGVVNKKWDSKTKQRYIGYDTNAWAFYLWSSEQSGHNDQWTNSNISLSPKVNDIFVFTVNMEKHRINIWKKPNNKQMLELNNIKSNPLALGLCLKKSTMSIIEYKRIE